LVSPTLLPLRRSLSAQSNSLSLTEVDSFRALSSDCPTLFTVHGIFYFEKVFVFCENKLSSFFFTLLGLFLVIINYIANQPLQPDRLYVGNGFQCSWRFNFSPLITSSRLYRNIKCDFTLFFYKNHITTEINDQLIMKIVIKSIANFPLTEYLYKLETIKNTVHTEWTVSSPNGESRLPWNVGSNLPHYKTPPPRRRLHSFHNARSSCNATVHKVLSSCFNIQNKTALF